MKKVLIATLVTAVLIFGLIGISSAKVLLCASDNETGFTENYLVGTGMFTADDIDYWNAIYSTPTVAELSAYDAVMVWVNSSLFDSTLLGDNLADYVDLGGGVVLAGFCLNPSANHLDGRITTAGYSPLTGDGGIYGDASLGTYDVSSPLMTGVSSLTGYYGRDTGTLNPGAVLAASWSDGVYLASHNHGGQVVDITLYPGEITQEGLSGDYAQLFANALSFSSNPVVPEPGSLFALGTGLIGLAGFIRMRKR